LQDAIAKALGRTAPADVRKAAGQEQAATPLHILLAEDNLVNQKVATGALRKRGHSVVVAVNGREAIQALEREPFDFILMDVQMPVMDGFEATAAIRDREKSSGKHIPILALTAHAMKGYERACLDAGMDGYISKPIQPSRMFQIAEGIVAARPAAAV
jgi:CheY-like chemotaxis protein